MGCISGMQMHLYGGDVSDAEASVHPFHPLATLEFAHFHAGWN